ncbi:hypothetical protein ElyMa_001495000, partial [Elysia marginata]
MIVFTLKSGGRNWVFEFTGPPHNDTPQSGRADLGIKWTLNDASFVDAGVYSCNVTFVDDGQLKTRSRQQEIRARPADTEPPPRMLSEPYIDRPGAKSPIVITCGTDVAGLPSQILNVENLTISRVLDSHRNKTREKIAIIDASDPKNDIKNIPEGRDWEIKFDLNTRHPVKKYIVSVIWTMRDAKMEDAGMYECEICTYGPDMCTLANPERLRFRAELQDMRLDVEPKRESNEYLEDDVIIITCKVK